MSINSILSNQAYNDPRSICLSDTLFLSFVKSIDIPGDDTYDEKKRIVEQSQFSTLIIKQRQELHKTALISLSFPNDKYHRIIISFRHKINLHRKKRNREKKWELWLISSKFSLVLMEMNTSFVGNGCFI